MTILVTGAAGFIGFHITKVLVEQGYSVIGLDNINDYYDVDLKLDRLNDLGFNKLEARTFDKVCRSEYHKALRFVRINLEDKASLDKVFLEEKPEVVCHLAAQAGVRYSLENPDAYVQSNVVGFVNLLECCRHFEVKHLVYASSSSVYGANEKIPFSTDDNVDHPYSLYAATKKSNELMAHTYSHLYGFATTGLRFFTVYGPWGRPDMAIYLFADAISKGKPIKVFNHGEMERDFTYIDDIVEGVNRILLSDVTNRKKYKLYNIGNNDSVKLMDFIKAIESNFGMVAQKEMLPMQPGDVPRTWADVSDLMRDYGYAPNTTVEEGVKKFVDWYKDYHQVNG
ncbi:NAD-dependent epimerase [Sediminicola luteus]|uniref:NAD-dependent epimerase n=1 Tax=Sediminicola luteus TaxID=319238 RepID=A0A2A4G4C1_9FLAO|nr:NAD-dependent epimerase [Sediminicola luteus]PCE62585.1 NAD-dependent epimerase [Sediminicola luteus]